MRALLLRYAAAVGALFVSTLNVQAQPLVADSSLPWVPNGSVAAVASAGSRVYLAGSFTALSPRTNVARGLLQTIGDEVAPVSVPLVDGEVLQIASDASGGWFIGGRFVAVDGQPRRNLARLRPNGSLDPAWLAGADGPIRAIAVSADVVYVGGEFAAAVTAVGTTVPRQYVAAFSLETQLLDGWNPDIRRGGGSVFVGVFDMLLRDRSVYVAGLFDALDPDLGFSQSSGLVRVSDAATVTPGRIERNLANGTVRRLLLSGDTLYLAGNFTRVRDVFQSSLAAINLGTENVTSWRPRIERPNTLWADIYDIAVAANVVYLGGEFSSVAGVTRNGLAAIDATTAEPRDWPAVPFPATAIVTTLMIDDQRLLTGGDFVLPSSIPRVNAASFDLAGGALSDWNPRPDSIARRLLAATGGAIWMAGDFEYWGAVSRRGLCRIDVATGSLTDWRPVIVGRGIRTLAVWGNRYLLVGGPFTAVDNLERAGLASFDAELDQWTAFNPQLASSSGETVDVWDLAIADTTLYVSRFFPDRLHAVNLGTGLAVTGFTAPTFATNQGPRQIAVAGTRLILAGATVGARSGLIAIDRATGSVINWNPQPPAGGWFGPIAVRNETIYAAYRDVTVEGVAAVSLASQLSEPVTPFFRTVQDGTIVGQTLYALAVDASTLYISGIFNRVGEVVRPALAAVDLATQAVTSWTPTGSFRITDLELRDDRLVAGGIDLRNFSGIPRVITERAAIFPREANGLPTAPLLLSGRVFAGSVRLAWYAPIVGPRPARYQLEAGSVEGSTNIATLPVTSTTFSALAPQGRYFVRVRGLTSSGLGPATSDAELVVGCQAADAPRSLAAVLSAGSLTLTWSAGGGAQPTGYVIEAGPTSGSAMFVLTLPVQTSYTTVPPPGTYFIRVRAFNNCGTSAPSNEQQVRVAPASPPGAPQNLAATINGRSVTLTWSPSVGAVSWYVVDAGTSAGLSDIASGLAVGSGTSFGAPVVAPGTYFVRVRALGPGGTSGPSNELQVIVP